MLNKNTLYSPKEALDADPNWTKPVKLGRGRMPVGGDEHCRTLAQAGYRIKGYDVEVNASTSTAPVVTRKKQVDAKVVQDYTILYDERVYKAIDAQGKEHTMRWVCNHCRVSLVQCHCGHPVIIGGVSVTIVPR